MDTCANISEWIEDYVNDIPDITTFFQFNLFKNKKGHVVLQQRQRCSSPPGEEVKWYGLTPGTEWTEVIASLSDGFLFDVLS